MRVRREGSGLERSLLQGGPSRSPRGVGEALLLIHVVDCDDAVEREDAAYPRLTEER